MNENKQTESGEGLAVAVIFLSIILGAFIGYYIITAIMTDHLRQKCNDNFYAKDTLSTKNAVGEVVTFSSIPDPQEEIKEVKYELDQTNAQYNKLETLFACYFDP